MTGRGDIARTVALMRKRAEGATDGTGASDWFRSGIRIRSSGGIVCESSRFEVDHIASWHPAVAFAVADLLERLDCNCHPADDDSGHCIPREVLTLTRAYLGDDE